VGAQCLNLLLSYLFYQMFGNHRRRMTIIIPLGYSHHFPVTNGIINRE
jgi:hypothetical protein